MLLLLGNLNISHQVSSFELQISLRSDGREVFEWDLTVLSSLPKSFHLSVEEEETYVSRNTISFCIRWVISHVYGCFLKLIVKQLRIKPTR